MRFCHAGYSCPLLYRYQSSSPSTNGLILPAISFQRSSVCGYYRCIFFFDARFLHTLLLPSGLCSRTRNEFGARVISNINLERRIILWQSHSRHFGRQTWTIQYAMRRLFQYRHTHLLLAQNHHQHSNHRLLCLVWFLFWGDYLPYGCVLGSDSQRS